MANDSAAETDTSMWWLAAVGISTALAVILIIGFGVGQEWGAAQWGPLSGWVSGLLTVAAVAVALRASILAQREAARARRSRLVDHELQRRRENIRCLSDLWGAIVTMGLDVANFRNYIVNLPLTFDPNEPRSDNAPAEPGDIPGEPICYQFGRVVQTFVERWFHTIEPPLFAALTILKGSALDEPVRSLNLKLRAVTENRLSPLSDTFAQGRQPDVTDFYAAWQEAAKLRREHLDLAREHFSLRLDDVERYLFG